MFFLFTTSVAAICQNLTASINLIQEPYCRTAGYQSGNGVLIASSTGGNGTKQYQWFDSTFTFISEMTVPTTVIRAPGKYYLKVTDEVGEQAIDSIVVDSINPIANFELESNDFYITEPNEAYDKAAVKIKNLAPPAFLQPPNIDDTLFFWTIKNNMNEIVRYYTQRPDEGIDTTFNHLGLHEICLVNRNYNHCKDTLCKEISVVSSMINDSDTPAVVVPDYQSQTVQFHSKEFTKNHIVNIFSIDGKRIQSVNLNSPIQTINFSQAKGVYVFSITLNGNLESSGKFVFSY